MSVVVPASALNTQYDKLVGNIADMRVEAKNLRYELADLNKRLGKAPFDNISAAEKAARGDPPFGDG
jgi:hypothetical protein